MNGGAAFNPIPQTSAYDGSTWQFVTQAGPAARGGHQMVYEPDRDRMVLFGGSTNQPYGPLSNDTWEFDGTTWTRGFDYRPFTETGVWP